MSDILGAFMLIGLVLYGLSVWNESESERHRAEILRRIEFIRECESGKVFDMYPWDTLKCNAYLQSKGR
jgi:hypothetical protein